ncbi:MBOAT family O-acyltransferase [Terasakiella pusilla]|uniref:MBOAT family O-acyltransferase n=1 Tax=Terasakiella pusilla TaxID=64973 RepID=UPI003AA9CA0C
MIFNSAVFALFFSFVFVINWALPTPKLKQYWLLLSSYVFYGWWDWRLLGLIIGVSLVAYGTAIVVDRKHPISKIVLGCAITLVLAVLGVFKYYGFFVESLMVVLVPLGLDSNKLLIDIVLPVGISFYSFQAISYMVDVKRGQIACEKSWVKVCLYIAFFPQLIAGPIVRAKSLIPQMDRKKQLNARSLQLGLRLFLLGMIYKVGIADNLAGFVDPVFDNLARFDQRSVILASVAFHSQIYFDFAGYSTMAVGLALMLGYRIGRNFRYPYLALNPTEFWKRWHMSLSRWFRDYLYIPLGGNRKGQGRWLYNLFLTMALVGLWHGAAWVFVIWGVLHGAALGLHKLFAKLFGRKSFTLSLIGFLLTQGLVLGLWTTFRVDDFSQLKLLWEIVLGGNAGGSEHLPLYAGLVFLPVLVDHLIGSRRGRFVSWKPSVFTFWLVVGVLVGVLLLIYPTSHPAFIYFQF